MKPLPVFYKAGFLLAVYFAGINIIEVVKKQFSTALTWDADGIGGHDLKCSNTPRYVLYSS